MLQRKENSTKFNKSNYFVLNKYDIFTVNLYYFCREMAAGVGRK